MQLAPLLLVAALGFASAPQAEAVTGRVVGIPDRDTLTVLDSSSQQHRTRLYGRDVGLCQIEAGLAWWYRKYFREQSPQDQVTYAQAEQAARFARVGLWQDSQECRRGNTGIQAPVPQQLDIACPLSRFPSLS